jgi:carboxylesterase
VPIILAIHGYSATTFEWDEFRDYSVNANYRISKFYWEDTEETIKHLRLKLAGWRSSITERI